MVGAENNDDKEKGVEKKVCIAIDEMMDDAREAGKELGKEEGRSEGRQEGINCTLVSNIECAIQNFGISLEEACKGLGTTIEKYERAKQTLNVSA